jgi:hypothetical protein
LPLNANLWLSRNSRFKIIGFLQSAIEKIFFLTDSPAWLSFGW